MMTTEQKQFQQEYKKYLDFLTRLDAMLDRKKSYRAFKRRQFFVLNYKRFLRLVTTTGFFPYEMEKIVKKARDLNQLYVYIYKKITKEKKGNIIMTSENFLKNRKFLERYPAFCYPLVMEFAIGVLSPALRIASSAAFQRNQNWGPLIKLWMKVDRYDGYMSRLYGKVYGFYDREMYFPTKKFEGLLPKFFPNSRLHKVKINHKCFYVIR